MIPPAPTRYEDQERQVKEAGTAYDALTDLIIDLAHYWYKRRIAGKTEPEPGADMRAIKETHDKLCIIRDNMTRAAKET